MSTSSVKIIAEAGVNHNGSVENAIKMIHMAKQAGADIIKFQTFCTEEEVSSYALKAEYQVRNSKDNELSQFNMLKKLELSKSDFKRLASFAKETKIEFMSTPFDVNSLNFLVEEVGVDRLKVASGEITFFPMLIRMAQSNKPMIVSTGMCSISDIEKALKFIALGYICNKKDFFHEKFLFDLADDVFYSEEGQRILKEKVTILQCTTEYPADFKNLNLGVIKSLKSTFGLNVGFSDHSVGIEASIAAVALGANVIEKHFTLNKNWDGPDHAASLNIDELNSMVRSIRNVESAIGSMIKMPASCEMKNRIAARKSLVAKKIIKKGDVFSAENLTCKRPGSGMSPENYWKLLGKQSSNDYLYDELIDED